MQPNNIYETMFDYAHDADITHYRQSNADRDAPNILVKPFHPSDDAEFCIQFEDEITRDGIKYVRVCWGESEESYLKESAIYDICYVRYILSFDNLADYYGEYISDGIVYDTADAAGSV